MRFLADMGVSQKVVQWLRDQGHDALHLRDENLQRSDDKAVFKKSSKEQRILMTFDLDFAEIVALSSGYTVSVMLFRLHNTCAPNVINRLKKVLADSSQSLEEGAIVVVEESRHRVRHLPIGA